jgi:hypothetical protein
MFQHVYANNGSENAWFEREIRDASYNPYSTFASEILDIFS